MELYKFFIIALLAFSCQGSNESEYFILLKDGKSTVIDDIPISISGDSLKVFSLNSMKSFHLSRTLLENSPLKYIESKRLRIDQQEIIVHKYIFNDFMAHDEEFLIFIDSEYNFLTMNYLYGAEIVKMGSKHINQSNLLIRSDKSFYYSVPENWMF